MTVFGCPVDDRYVSAGILILGVLWLLDALRSGQMRWPGIALTATRATNPVAYWSLVAVISGFTLFGLLSLFFR
jgi:hypothetical protein